MKDIKEYVKEKFILKFPHGDTFEYFWSQYLSITPFAPNGNVHDIDSNNISEESHFCMRITTQYHLNQAFLAMKIDMTDDNVKEDLLNGNISTPGRISKVWSGGSMNDDTELGGGRWAVKPRIASFPNTGNKSIPITKRIDIISNCSHHFIPFHTLARPDSYAIISYVPDEHVLGISKLQRLANWVSQRFFLQEDLTRMLYEEVSKVAETKSVYVCLYNMTHGCEALRGPRSNDGAFTSECYGGKFEDIQLRNQVRGS